MRCTLPACQVRLAFLGGLAVVLLLVPINKWLAKRIEAATNTKMTFKDLRVKRTGELLRGIHQIKAAAWEPAFMAHVRTPSPHRLPHSLMLLSHSCCLMLGRQKAPLAEQGPGSLF